MCCGARNISTSLQKARKDYHDDSTEYIKDSLLDYVNPDLSMLTFSEKRSIAKLKANEWKIKKGQMYERQFNIQEGQAYTFKSLPEIVKICQKLHLYCVC